MQVPFLFKRVFAGALVAFHHEEHEGHEAQKWHQALRALRALRGAEKNLHLRQLRCAPFPQVKRMAMNCCKRPAGYSNKISAVPACFIMK
jgi:hypothetical protein